MKAHTKKTKGIQESIKLKEKTLHSYSLSTKLATVNRLTYITSEKIIYILFVYVKGNMYTLRRLFKHITSPLIRASVLQIL